MLYRLKDISLTKNKVLIYMYYEDSGFLVIDEIDYQNKEVFLHLLKKYYMSMDPSLGNEVEIYKCNTDNIEKIKQFINDVYNEREDGYEKVEEFEGVWDDKLDPYLRTLETIDNIHNIEYEELLVDWGEEKEEMDFDDWKNLFYDRDDEVFE